MENSKKINGTDPVLIVGGSLVGLSAAAFLAWKNVPVILVEKHRGSSLHPRAVGYTTRTIELFRSIGIEDKLPKNQKHFQLRRAKVKSLAGELIEETEWTPGKKKESVFSDTDYSPVQAVAIAQDGLEPILRTRALELGADLRLGTEMISFHQNDEAVTAVVKERDSGKEYTINASYMIAADGSESPVREALRIARKGRGLMNVVRSVLFRASLDEYLESGISQFEIEQPNLKAFLTTYRDGRWVLMFTDDVDRNEEETMTAIRQAIGRADIPVEIITKGRWDLSALITDQFKDGRIFLAGDSAHTLPPTRGGFGANTGIHDVHNLAWKLAAVTQKASGPELLFTYQQERWPVAWNRYQQTFIRPDYAKFAKQEDLQGVKIFDDIGMELGQLYRSAAVIGAGEDLPLVKRPDEWNGQPGTRALHVWLNKNGERISSHDLFQKDWVLITENKNWCSTFQKVTQKTQVKGTCVLLGEDIVPEIIEDFRRTYGIGPTGASLIRPDGYVACRWEDIPAAHEQIFEAAFRQVSFSI